MVLLVLLVIVALLSLAVGAKPIPLPEVWQAIWSPTGSEADLVVRTLRAPRTLLGLVVGIALGVAGALIQGHTRNPLADPGLLGVSAGAAFMVVIGIYAFGITNLYGYVWLAFAGAFAASVVVFVLGTVGGGGPTPVTLALAGRGGQRLPGRADLRRGAGRQCHAQRIPVLGGRQRGRTRYRTWSSRFSRSSLRDWCWRSSTPRR